MSNSKKVVISGAFGTVAYLIGKIIDFAEFVAVSYSPSEAATRMSQWKPVAKVLVGGPVLMWLAIAIVVGVLAFFLIDPIGKVLRRKTAFEKLVEKHGRWSFHAQWGISPQWMETTLHGISLTAHVISQICMSERTPPIPAKHHDLDLPEFLPTRDKVLRLTYPDQHYIEIPEKNGLLRLDPSLTVFPPDPRPKNIVPVVVVQKSSETESKSFDPEDIVYAEYGNAENGFAYWPLIGKTGEELAAKLKGLFKRSPPEQLTNGLLDVDDPINGPHKKLRFRLSDGRCFFLNEYGRINIDSAILMDQPFQPYEIESVKIITARIPPEKIPSDDAWQPVIDAINPIIRKFVGCKALFHLTVDETGIIGNGRYKGIVYVVALHPLDQKTKLPVLLWVYFNHADVSLMDRVRSHQKHDPMTVRGKISRADISQQPQGYRLNIDLSECEIVD